MKKTILLLLAILICTLYGCKDNQDTPEDLNFTVSQTTFTDLSAEENNVQVNMTCNKEWTAISNTSWCTVTPTTGNGNTELSITLAANESVTSRTAIITLKCKDLIKQITLSQKGIDFSTYKYTIPVIFHVFYKDKSNPLQYVDASRLKSILENVNTLYKKSGIYDKINFEFELATTDKIGNKLSTPGVEYVYWNDSYPIDYMNFMTDNTGKYTTYLWEPNDYINVMIYNFKDDSSTSITLGISHLPLSIKGNTFLEGLNETTYTSLNLSNLKYALCVSINSLKINSESTNKIYDPSDINVTLAHELGHYLGLHHVFSETESTLGCEDTDFCTDTESYNFNEYQAYCDDIYKNHIEEYTFQNLLKRTNCSNLTFISKNIMDYAVGYANEFTAQQAARMRHVLVYSPLIPGPKNISSQSTSSRSYEGPLDLPIKVLK